MKCHFSPDVVAADLIAIPFWEGPLEAVPLGNLEAILRPWLVDFQGKLGEVLCQYVGKTRYLLLGMGKMQESDLESHRIAMGHLFSFAKGKKCRSVAFLFPKERKLPLEEALYAVIEGAILASYCFTYKSKEESRAVEHFTLVGVSPREEEVKRAEKIAQGVFFARDLVNQNADTITPHYLSETAKGLQHRFPKTVKTTIFDKARLEKEKMGLLLAVGQGSSVDPLLGFVEYKGVDAPSHHIVLVGKGVTYDTGGYSLKPTDGMFTMKCDMAGAAAVLGTIVAIAELNLPIHVTAVFPATENAIGPKSYKLGDVFTSYLGKTVEINNTDAEGRLILADALAYAAKNLHPTCMIDLATLTGAMVVALGEEMAGLFSDEIDLREALLKAADVSGDALWPMPLVKGYAESMKSDLADFVNSFGREGGAIKAALFLKEFSCSIPWAHLDIAGPAYLSKAKGYHPAKGTGYGVRLLVEYLSSLVK